MSDWDPLRSAPSEEEDASAAARPSQEPTDTDRHPAASSEIPLAGASLADPLSNAGGGDAEYHAVATYRSLLSPTSYEDDTAAPQQEEIETESQTNTERGALDASTVTGGTAASAGEPLLEIVVTDPVKKVEQGLLPGVSGGYVMYRVDTRTTLPSYQRRQMSVRRRFKDVVALHELVKVKHRGYFIPPRPEKNAVEGQRASENFVEMRKAAIQTYLCQLAAHPVIGTGEELRVFLEAEGPLGSMLAWQQLQLQQGSLLEGVARLPKQLLGTERSVTLPADAVQSTTHTNDLLRRFKEIGANLKAHSDYPEDETALRHEKVAVEDFLEHLATASRKAESVVSQLDDLGNVLGDVGLSLVKLGKFEDEEGTRCGHYTDSAAASKAIALGCRSVGMAAVRLSRLSRAATAQSTTALEPIHSQMALTPSAVKALRERETALVTVQAITDDLDKKTRAVGQLEVEGSKVFGGDKLKTRKAVSLQSDVAALELSKAAAHQEYERVKLRNVQELDRWKQQRAKEFGAMLHGFAVVQTAFHDRAAAVWSQAADDLSP